MATVPAPRGEARSALTRAVSGGYPGSAWRLTADISFAP